MSRIVAIGVPAKRRDEISIGVLLLQLATSVSRASPAVPARPAQAMRVGHQAKTLTGTEVSARKICAATWSSCSVAGVSPRAASGLPRGRAGETR